MLIKELLSIYKQPAVMAFGNPLLDTIIINEDNSLTPLLKKLKLNIDGEAEIEEKHMEELLKDIPKDARKITVAGGAALNTMRFLQKLADDKSGRKLSAFYGCIGKDKNGEILKKLIDDANVGSRFAVDPCNPTGTAVAVITGEHRSLAANIGAAGHYAMKYLEAERLPLESVKVLYIEGFFIAHSYDVAKKVISKVEALNGTVVFNLSGEYLFKDFDKEMCDTIGMSKVIIGNVREMKALAQSLSVAYEDPLDIPFCLNQTFNLAISSADKSSPHWQVNGCVVVMTQGGDGPAIVVWGAGNSHKVPPYKTRHPVRDTTGAGDALVAGFLAGLLTGQPPPVCLDWGCRLAAEVVTQLGASLPDDLPESVMQPVGRSAGSVHRRH